MDIPAHDNAEVLLNGFVHLCTQPALSLDLAPQLFEEEPL